MVETLIRKAPGYWKRMGEWDANVDEYESWCSRRKYRELTWVN